MVERTVWDREVVSSNLTSPTDIYTHHALTKKIRMRELVVLVNEQNEEIGTCEKIKLHTSNTPLHRGFSVFILSDSGKTLIQKRSNKKKTFPLIWSNACCGHPLPGESVIDAAKRRLMFELGIAACDLEIVLPDFRYRAVFKNVMENEICPVLVGFYHGSIKINKNEVEKTEWILWSEFLKKAKSNDVNFSFWSKKEAIELAGNRTFKNLLKKITS